MAETKRNVPLLVLSGILSLAFLGAGGAKLMGVEEILASFEKFGFAPWFATFIGVCEVAGAIGLWIRKLAAVAAAGLVVLMVGAVSNHLMYDPIAEAVPPAVLGVLAVIVVLMRRVDLPVALGGEA